MVTTCWPCGESGEDLGLACVGDAGFNGGLVRDAVGADDHDGGLAGGGDDDGFRRDDEGFGRGAAGNGDVDGGAGAESGLWDFRGGPRLRLWCCRDRERD